MQPFEMLALLLAATAAGAINAVAGGGTLITFPALIFFGTPAIIANATSTLALMLGTSGSMYGYRQHLPAVKPWLWRFAPISVVGGIIGAFLLTFTSNKVFSKLVPFLILFASILFLVQGLLRRFSLRPSEYAQGNRTKDGRLFAIGGAILFQLVVAIYGGYFGAGIGIFMLACLGFLGLGSIYEMNTLKTILSSLINLVASVWFICSGLIDWPKASIMTLGALAGYYLGSHYSQRIPPIRVRQIITAIGFILSAVTFYKEFVK